MKQNPIFNFNSNACDCGFSCLSSSARLTTQPPNCPPNSHHLRTAESCLSDIYHEWKQNLGRKQDVIKDFTSWPQVTSEWQPTGNIYSGVFLESSFTDLRLWWTGEAHRSWGRIDQGSGPEWSAPSKEQIWFWRKQNEFLGRRQENRQVRSPISLFFNKTEGMANTKRPHKETSKK